ncbi:MAG TPA: glycosyltransferase [Syntrophorhabdales bacterium]|nr:glycosyltransferase [Syntrophorhabdales bacterium]
MKILLLTGMPPCTNYTAGLVLNQLCSFLPEGSLGCFSVLHPAHNPEIPERWTRIPHGERQRPREHWGLTQSERLRSFITETCAGKARIGSLARSAISFGKDFGADLLWCILEGQTLIRMAIPVAKGLGIPLYTQVWDPPGWWFREHRIDLLTARSVMNHYHKALRSSACVAAASWAMAEEYGKDYGIRAVPVVPGLDVGLAQPAATEVHKSSELLIGVAGQLYASAEWKALISALDSVHWKIAGKEVRIRLLGREFTMITHKEARVEFLGWRSQEETIRLLSEADILYCPYWFDPVFETEARLCFPSKLITYLAAGRPVLFHGPAYASPARFLEAHNAAVFCNSLVPSEVAATLQLLVSDKDRYRQVAQSGRAAFEEHLTLVAARKSFFEFLG